MKNILLPALLLSLATSALAGPPLICHPVEIGDAKSLLWKAVNGWQGADPAYPIERLVEDTMALLGKGVPLPVRMETLRRAAIYAARDPRIAESLALRLTSRALDRPDAAIILFDAGFFVEAVAQSAHIYKYDMISPAEKANWKARQGITGVRGREWVRRAIDKGGVGMEPVLAKMAD